MFRLGQLPSAMTTSPGEHRQSCADEIDRTCFTTHTKPCSTWYDVVMDGRSSASTFDLRISPDAYERHLRRPIAQAEPPPRPHLVVIHGAELGRSYDLTGPATTLGRSASNGIRVVDDSVSRTHATVTIDRSGIMRIRDEGSKNGILVNGVNVREALLQRGDVIHIGHTMFAVALLEPGMTAVDALGQVSHARHFQTEPEPEAEPETVEVEACVP
jgi:hypothetical protein